MITTLSFDLDDTLWPIAPAIEAAEQALRDWLQQHWPTVAKAWSAERMAELRDGLWQQHPELAHDFTRLRQLAIERMLQPAGGSAADVDAAFDVFYEARNRVQFYPEARAVLDRLAGRYRLIAISNGNACLRRTGLDAVFVTGIHARQVGVAKPDPAIFHHACATIGERPERVLHIGDHPRQDVEGALQAGLRAAWLDRDQRDWPERPDRVPRLRCLAELERWLERIPS